VLLWMIDMAIHPSAIISPSAKIASGVTIGPYAVVEGDVEIGEGTELFPHAMVFGPCVIGRDCRIHPGAVLGNIPQDLKFQGEDSFLEIGDRNVFRESVTVNRATGEGMKTMIGDDNLLMAYSHIGHNCILGNHLVLANASTVAGHVRIDDWAILGGLTGVHQFCRIGTHAIVGGCSKVTKDILPFVLADGDPARPHGINTVGLKRRGFDSSVLHCLAELYQILFRSGLNITQALERLAEYPDSSELQILLAFIRSADRGIARPKE
jgi:UDP-N-acetylglucosamine acyltransferase